MKKTVQILVALVVFTAYGQYKINDGTELLNLQKVPLEKMYVHHTSPVLFSGEYLYYKVYCINAQTNRRSNISSMAYVELIDHGGNSVFKHKLRLQKGMAQGDFFLNTETPSGNYKLVAYTEWMKNGGLEQLFQDDIAIINPYLVDQSQILNGDETRLTDSFGSQTIENPGSKNNPIALITDTLVFKKRQKVNLSLRNFQGNLGYGDYSIAVKRKEKLSSKPALTAVTFGSTYLNANKKIPQTIGDSIYLPEQRGELVFGEVLEKGQPVAGKEVVISIPGKEFVLTSAITDDNGIFYAYIKKPYKDPSYIFQVNDGGNYAMKVKDQSGLDFKRLKMNTFRLQGDMVSEIKSRSVHNQIENVFFGVKPDSIIQPDAIDPYDGGIPEVFVLDEYTRFPTLQETLIEILNTVGYRNGPEGKDYIRVAQDFEKFDEPYNDYEAIVLIDGVFIPDHESIKDFSADRIELIKVLRDQLVLGPNQYQGIVYIETKNEDFAEDYNAENAYVEELSLPEPVKNYFRQQYSDDGDTFKRVPDYRYVLLWEPNVELNDAEEELVFYTSDVTGDFEIILEGFTTYGKPLSLRKTFTVE